MVWLPIGSPDKIEPNNLKIPSDQPKIVENINNLPIDFVINGSFNTPDESGYQDGVMTIDFEDLQSAGEAGGYWLLTSTMGGYYIEFSSTLRHKSYLGAQLVFDSLSETFMTFIPGSGSNPSYLLQGGEGLMVYAKTEKTITFTSALCVSYDFLAGTNLLSFAACRMNTVHLI